MVKCNALNDKHALSLLIKQPGVGKPSNSGSTPQYKKKKKKYTGQCHLHQTFDILMLMFFIVYYMWSVSLWHSPGAILNDTKSSKKSEQAGVVAQW